MEESFRAHALNNKLNGSCWKFIPVYSDGIWNLEDGENIFRHTLLRLYVQLALIFILTSFMHFALKRIHLPRIISEILVGIILGPSLIGHFLPNVSEILFPPQSEKIMSSLTSFGYIFFIFLIGVKMDMKLITKSTKREWYISGFLMINMILVTICAVQIKNAMDPEENSRDWISFFAGTLMLTSFPVVACFLIDLKIINSELGHIALSTALVADLMSVFVVNFYDYARIMVDASFRAGIKSIVLSLALLVFISTALKQLMVWIIRRTPEGKPVKSGYIVSIVFLVMVVAIIGDNVGLQYLYGPFIFGLTVPTGPPLASSLVEKLDTIVSGLFLPLMATYCGYKSNLWELNQTLPHSLAFIMSFGLIMKAIAVFVPAIWFKVGYRDAVALMLILSAKGIVELGTFAINSQIKQTFDSGQFTMAVVAILTMATIVPLLVGKLHDPLKIYPGYQLRNILHSSKNDGLRVLVCTHRQEEALAAVRLLNISNPTRESPLFVFGLYLKALVGRSSTTQLINHQLDQKASKFDQNRHWKQPIINVFKYFKSENPINVNLQVFSAISPPKLMHEDICWVAFDKAVSLIILPFHRKWNVKGELVSDSDALRNLNTKILNNAPSSVGILLDRSQISGPSIFMSPSIYNVAVLYMGGEDDMEALAYARRMAGSSKVHLTVIEFVAPDNFQNTSKWKDMLEYKFLNGVKSEDEMSGQENMLYREVIVRDGADTAAAIQSIGDKYDLVMVGCRHRDDSPITSGLSCELPELGPMADLFASSDITSPVSVLVIQQQLFQDSFSEKSIRL
ncbi:hypothetical protein Ddye_031564 [Dipteronia dyeriana]|uniref:Cation/H+ exchanger domain-containing protein n=1 Tax=Dipteronia dyeriana TaxID=168575 RepID=A0AAD9TIL6_9ROSI|nr:hypothetical protein Ddye_031564 [Dipteronia dyeriana]